MRVKETMMANHLRAHMSRSDMSRTFPKDCIMKTLKSSNLPITELVVTLHHQVVRREIWSDTMEVCRLIGLQRAE